MYILCDCLQAGLLFLFNLVLRTRVIVKFEWLELGRGVVWGGL